MSDRPLGEDWWLASDGKWYPPQSAQQPPPPPPPPGPGRYPPVPGGFPPGYGALARPAHRLSRGLDTAVRVFLYLVAAAAALSAVAQVNEITRFSDWERTGSLASLLDLEDAESLTAGFTTVTSLVGLTLWILLIIWLNQAYRAATEPAGATGRSWSSGWAVGGWFIPFANAIIPRLVLNEIERVSHPDNGPAPIGDRWVGKPLIGAGMVWWIGTIVGLVIAGIGAALAGGELESVERLRTLTDFDPDTYRSGLWLIAIGFVVSGAAALIGTRFMKPLGGRLLKP